ncbi:MAG: hypothetical protein HYV45_03150 [Candidatus Moranbacteria bacterium]|nr:hypothetical protein [Candidatus Moranbacteria bacterium]
MQSEKPSFARFGGKMNFAGSGNQDVSQTVSSQENLSDERGSRTATIFDMVISVSLVALFFGLPLFFTGVTFQGIAFEKQMYFYFWLLIGVVAWASKGVITGEMRIRRTPIDIPIALFWLFYVVVSIFSVDRWHSFWGFFGDPSRGIISVTALVLVYYLVMSHFTIKRFQWMFWSFLLSGFIVTLWSFLVVMKISFLPDAWAKFAPMSLIGTISTLGIFLSLLIPLAITALFVLWNNDTEKKVRRMVLTGVIFFGLLLALFLLLALYSFVSYIVLLGGLSFFVVYVLARIVRPSEQWTWVPMVVFVAALIFLMIGTNTIPRANLPIEVAPNSTLSWQIAKESLKEDFFAGVGSANYGYAFSMFRPHEYNLNALYTLRFYQGTGLFFEALPTIGIIGTLLFVGLWLTFVSVGLYLLSHDKQRNKLYSLGFWTVVVMLFLAMFVSAINGTLILIGVLLAALALAILFSESNSEEQYLHLSLKAAPKFALALAFIFMVISAGVAFLFVFMGKVFFADVYAGKAVGLSSLVGPSVDSVRSLSHATETYPQEGRYYTRLAQEYMALANIEAAKGEKDRDTDKVASYVRSAVSTGERGKMLMPNDVMATESLGLIYENAGLYASDALVKAEEMYRRALELEPRNPLYFVKLGQIKKLNGDQKGEGTERDGLYNEAKAFFEKAIEEKENLAPAHYNLAVVLSRLKDTDGAIERAREALSFDRDNLNYKYNLAVLHQVRGDGEDKKIAEDLFKDILSVNSNLIDVHLSLGLLYEGENKRDLAIEQYQKILDLLPKDGGDNVKETREQVEKFITNVRNGSGNLNKKNASTNITPPTEESAAPLPQVPSTPNESPFNAPQQ